MPESSINRDALPYRKCAGVCLFNAAGLVFVGERIDTPGAWQMPQGGIDEGEDIKTAAFRELEEETGIINAELIRVSDTAVHYDLPDALLPKLWNGKYRGQEQIWSAMRFNGDDSEINLNAHTPPEFSNWQWVELKKTVDLIVPFKQETYKQIIELFSDIKV